jgi:hypothetical protein
MNMHIIMNGGISPRRASSRIAAATTRCRGSEQRPAVTTEVPVLSGARVADVPFFLTAWCRLTCRISASCRIDRRGRRLTLHEASNFHVVRALVRLAGRCRPATGRGLPTQATARAVGRQLGRRPPASRAVTHKTGRSGPGLAAAPILGPVRAVVTRTARNWAGNAARRQPRTARIDFLV